MRHRICRVVSGCVVRDRAAPLAARCWSGCRWRPRAAPRRWSPPRRRRSPLAVPVRAAADRRAGGGARGEASAGGRGAGRRRRRGRRPGRRASRRRPADAADRAARRTPQRARAEGAEATTAAGHAAPLLRTRETANDAEATRKVREVLVARRAEPGQGQLPGPAANGQGPGRHRHAASSPRPATPSRSASSSCALSLADKAEALSTQPGQPLAPLSRSSWPCAVGRAVQPPAYLAFALTAWHPRCCVVWR